MTIEPRRQRLLLVIAALPFFACSAQADAVEADRIADLLALQPGQTVADVGAGDGEWTEALAERVGPDGRVIATEVEDDLVDDLQERLDDAGFENVDVVLGDQESTGLPTGCCDGILLRMVYHHFVHPEPMREDLANALRPGGRLLVCDIEPQSGWRDLPDVPDRGGHGIPQDQLVEEMATDGFRPTETQTDWNDEEERYCVVFRHGR